MRITNSLGNHEDIEAEYVILANSSRPDGYPVITHPDGEEISPGLVLVATGRRPNVESIGLYAQEPVAKQGLDTL